MSNLSNICIISGPAGSGKDAIIHRLETILPIEKVITTTTRAPRPGETEGNPYFFISQQQFTDAIQEHAFFEYSTNENGILYGVSNKELDRVSKQTQRIGIWKIDWKGVISAKTLHPNIIAILVHAPLSILEERLRMRDSGQTEQYFSERMAYTREWLKHTDIYDYIVENEQGELEKTVEQIKNILLRHSTLSAF